MSEEADILNADGVHSSGIAQRHLQQSGLTTSKDDEDCGKINDEACDLIERVIKTTKPVNYLNFN